MTTHPHLERLAGKPRPVGTEAIVEARRYCSLHLQSHGLSVAERSFEFSALPGRYGAQILGLVGAACAIGNWLLRRPAPTVDDGVPFLMLIAFGLVMWRLARRRATDAWWMRERGVNLEAVRGIPKVWLVAHIDSKSQPISSAVRTVGVLLLAIGLIGPVLTMHMLAAFSVSGLVGGSILLLAAVGAASDGAADNASGVAAVLDAVALIPAETSLGVLITDAEELALAGAVAWVEGKQKAIAINCDTIDDRGRLVVFRYGRDRSFAARCHVLAQEFDGGAKLLPPPPGVLTDSNAFAKAKWTTVTLARGTLRTLNRIHTRRDSLESMRGTGIPDAARLLARLVEEFA